MSNGKMEDMLTQLITMVGSIQAEVVEIKTEVQELKTEVQELKTDVQEIKDRQEQLEIISEKRHIEILRGFRSIRADQDFVWEKTMEHEKEIARLKNQ